MVVDKIHPHGLHEAVIALGGEPLKEGILRSGGANTINDFAALLIFIQHPIYRINVILQIRIHGDDHIAVPCCLFHAGQQSVLMATVAAQLNAGEGFILPVECGNDFPCAVGRTIVHEQHPAVRGNPAGSHQFFQLCLQPLGRFRKHFLFLVAGDDNIQSIHGIPSFLKAVYLPFEPLSIR